jgi:hypothetical protein
MSKHSGPFPNPDAEFNDYLQPAVPYLNVNWDRLVPASGGGGVPPSPPPPGGTPDPRRAQMMELFARWNIKYPLSQNPNTRTATITDDKDELREDIESLMRGIFADIPQSRLTNADRETLHLPRRDAVPSPRPAMDSAPFTDLKAGDGSTIKFTNRISSDASRASMHPDTDVLEMKWILVAINAPAPSAPEACPNTEISTKAIFSMPFGIANAGKRFYCYMRWRNNTDPQKSSPYSQIMTIVLSD